MVERQRDEVGTTFVERLRDEAGTTLTELLVVMVVLGVIGSVTTVGIVSGFRAQLESSNIAETLDGMRLATQRVRDYVRSGTEVCSDSGEKMLRLWTDDNSDGIVDPIEIDVFELVTVDGSPVFQRRTETASGEVVQLIRDDIISEGTEFDYDTDPANQPPDLRCGTPGTGSAPVRRVDVLFSVNHPEPGAPALKTSTSVRLRNANLAEPSRNEPPSASFTVSCPQPDLTCYFDGSASSDPEDGTVSFYSWEIIDVAADGTRTVVHSTSGNNLDVFSHPFDLGTGDRDYEVLLTVTDTDGAPDSTGGIAHPVEPGSNPPPVAEFTVTCTGLSCTSFDASASTDDSGAIASYDWDFGDGNTGTGVNPSHTYGTGGTYTITLTVTDGLGATATKSRVLDVGTHVTYVSNMSAIKSGSGNNRVGTVSTQLSLTIGGNPGAGLVITISATDKDGVALEGSCETNSSGNCSVAFDGLNNARFPLTATVLSVTNTGSYVYDSDQDTVTEVTVS